MPLFIYTREKDDGSGEELERFYHSNPPELLKHNGEMWKRSRVVSVAIVGLKPPPAQGNEILRGYYDQECKMGSRFHSKLPAEKIKNVWKDDSLSADEVAADNGDVAAQQRLAMPA